MDFDVTAYCPRCKATETIRITTPITNGEVLARARELHERNTQHFSSALEIREYTPVTEFYHSVPSTGPAINEQFWAQRNRGMDLDFATPEPYQLPQPVKQPIGQPAEPEPMKPEPIPQEYKPITRKQYRAMTRQD
jgi:hypothetical protein